MRESISDDEYPMSILIAVVLPAPFGPSIPKHSPRLMPIVNPRTACVCACVCISLKNQSAHWMCVRMRVHIQTQIQPYVDSHKHTHTHQHALQAGQGTSCRDRARARRLCQLATANHAREHAHAFPLPARPGPARVFRCVCARVFMRICICVACVNNRLQCGCKQAFTAAFHASIPCPARRSVLRCRSPAFSPGRLCSLGRRVGVLARRIQCSSPDRGAA